MAEEAEIEKLKAQIDELNDKYLRQVAEFENFKRRNAKERMELIQTAGKDVIIDCWMCWTIANGRKKAWKVPKTWPQIKEGVQLVFNKLRNSLQAKG